MADHGEIEDVPADATWERLKADAGSVLVDVRTRAEWTFVGLPDVEALGKRLIAVEWQSFPDNRINPAFVETLATHLEKLGIAKNAEVFFLCRSGARSRAAAAAMAEAGYSHCRNVADGFEGPLDAVGQRGGVAGWKAAGLPWRQG